MNEKIKQLAEQSGFYFYDLHDVDGQDLGETIEADSWDVADKFAIAIIRECASICEHRYTYMNKDMSEGAFEAMACHDSILEHFGIE